MKRVRRPQGPKAISMNIYFYNSRNKNLFMVIRGAFTAIYV